MRARRGCKHHQQCAVCTMSPPARNARSAWLIAIPSAPSRGAFPVPCAASRPARSHTTNAGTASFPAPRRTRAVIQALARGGCLAVRSLLVGSGADHQRRAPGGGCTRKGFVWGQGCPVAQT